MLKDTDIVERLNNHSLPIDESYWAEMEERLQRKRKKTAAPWVWFSGTGIAASLALLLTWQIFDVEDMEMQTTQQITQVSVDKESVEQFPSTFNPIEETQNSAKITGTQIAQKIQNAANDTKSNKKQHKSVLSASSAFKNIDTQIAQIEQISAENTTNEQHQNLRESLESASSACSKNDTVSEKQDELNLEYYEQLLLAANEPIIKSEKEKQKNSWEIAAAVSSSNTSNSSNNDFTFLADNNMDDFLSKNNGKEILPPGFNSNPGKINSIVDKDRNNDPPIDDTHGQFPEVTHLPPLSVGLTVRKNLNKHLAVETGLTYTFLQSKFKEESEWRHRDATQQLHYLGIPVNAVAYLLNKPKWNVYFSLGGMVEKGIMQDYVQHSSYNILYFNENQPLHTISLQDDISGLQWSANASFGIGYKFYRDISIYFEPRIIYYFKNNQPLSVRTETPLSVGLNTGLRFEF